LASARVDFKLEIASDHKHNINDRELFDDGYVSAQRRAFTHFMSETTLRHSQCEIVCLRELTRTASDKFEQFDNCETVYHKKHCARDQDCEK
jgi:hypothetical protein